MEFETDLRLNPDSTGAAALRPLAWIIFAALAAVVTLMFAPVPPL